MKPDQYKAWKSIRKPTPPPTRIERPKKGAPYRRPTKNWRTWSDE